jgi:WhiB family redox-sensing transcriptional regulator
MLSGGQGPRGAWRAVLANGGSSLMSGNGMRAMANPTAHDWRNEAACRHHDPDLFFPEGTAGPALRDVDKAKQVCQACKVRTACLGFALTHDLAFGIWGGTTAQERYAIRPSAARASSARPPSATTAGRPRTARPARPQRP